MSQGITQAAFARKINVKPGYVTQLKNAGRLVLDDRGKVLADESIKLIAETQDPSKEGVAERHAIERKNKEAADDESKGSAGNLYQQSKAIRAKYDAMESKRSYEVAIGQLLRIDDVRAAVMDGDTIVRNRLESMPDILSPQLAVEDDEHKIRIILIDHVEWLLSELSQSMKKLDV